MTATSTSRAEALQRAEDAYASIREYVEGIAESDMQRPNRVGVWSGKDLVIHIAIGESVAAGMLGDLSAGQPERSPSEGVDINALNESRVSEHAGMALRDALNFWQARHDELMDAYRRASVEREDILMTFTLHHYHAHYSDFRHVKPFQSLSEEDRNQLIADMDESHADFLALIDSIPDERLLAGNTVGVWSGKDLIAHLGHWQEAATALTRELEADRPGKWPGEDESNINEWNESRVAAMRDLDLSETRAFLQSAYDQLRDLMASSPYATRSAGIGATRFHYDIHREDFESLM